MVLFTWAFWSFTSSIPVSVEARPIGTNTLHLPTAITSSFIDQYQTQHCMF